MPEQYADDVCKGICHYHEDRDKLISEVKGAVDKHSGYWKFFFWAVGLCLSVIVAMTYSIRETVKCMEKTVTELSRTVAVGNEQHRNNVSRLDHHSAYLRELDSRMRDVEHEVE